MSSTLGNQIFVSVRKGGEYPPKVVDVRVKYEETVGDIRRRAAVKLGIAPSALQLFWHGRELSSSEDANTLLDMNLHTGFALQGYDLTEEPVYWPKVAKNPETGLLEVARG